MKYVERTYRNRTQTDDMVSFALRIKESDLLISVDRESYNPEIERMAFSLLKHYRRELERYIEKDPVFKWTLEPRNANRNAHHLILLMAAASRRAGVGPMAAVAGAVATFVGHGLLKCVKEVIVENGGDIFIKSYKPRIIGIFAGDSPLSERVGIKLQASFGRGICTSSGTVGPSLSFGYADAAVVVSKSAALADAAATALGNRIQTEKDFAPALAFVSKIRGVEGAVIIKGNKLGAIGKIELVPVR